MSINSDIKKEGASKISLPQLNPTSKIPLYHQLFNELSEQIKDGVLPNGCKLPSEQEFVSQLGVSRITVTRAINELAAAGLVTRKRGRGTRVTLNTELEIVGGVDEMVNNVIAMRLSTTAELLSRETMPAPDSIAENLKVTTDTLVEKIKYRLILKGSPLSLNTIYIPKRFSKKLSDEDIEKESVITLLESSGIRVARADQKIQAVISDKFESDALNVKEEVPLLEIHCLMKDRDGTPIQDVTTLFRPEYYRYEMTLTRKRN